MKPSRIALLMVGIVWVLLGLTPKAWGGAPGASPSCQVANPGSGAIALRGTVAAEILNPSGVDVILNSNKDIDYTLRLQRGSGSLNFFRLHKVGFGGVTLEEFLCFALEDPVLKSQILTAFGLPSTSTLAITSNSVSNTQSLDPNTLEIPGLADFAVPESITFTCVSRSQVQVEVAGTSPVGGTTSFQIDCSRGQVVQVNLTTQLQLLLQRFSTLADVTIYAIP